jgi:hypothetical protein
MKYWPVIRHIRWVYWAWKVDQHYRLWGEIGFLPVNAHYDFEHLDRIWKGLE